MTVFNDQEPLLSLVLRRAVVALPAALIIRARAAMTPAAAVQREAIRLAPVMAILAGPAAAAAGLLRLPPVMNDGKRSTSPPSGAAGCGGRGVGG